MSDTLRCSTCQRDLPDDDFSIKNGAPGRGFRHYRCRECVADSSAALRVRSRKLILGAKDVPCADCGVRYPFWITQFDHVPERGPKLFNISNGSCRALQKLKDEIAKCDVVCANCHAARTHKSRLQAIQQGETFGCIVPLGTRRSPKTQTPSLPAPLPDEPTLFDIPESR